MENLLENRSLYKEYHENAMKNNNGTTAFANFLIILPAFHTTFLVVYLGLAINIREIWKRFLLEYAVIVSGIVLCVTILSHKSLEVNIALGMTTILLAAQHIKKRLHLEPFIQIPVKKPNYLNTARATINLITVVCILAVDFQIFPRAFGKTETFGFGLMDVGVGLYVFSNGIISPDRHGSVLNLTKVRELCFNSLPLILLGFSRFLVVQQIDYQVHTSEYGVHWNFFLTLAFTKIFGSFIVALIQNVEYTKFASIIILTLHELGLQLGLGRYILDEHLERNNFFTANREGICSIPGYVGLYLACVYIGHLLKSDVDVVRPKEFIKSTAKLTAMSIILWKLIYICNGMFGVSRRLANMGYVTWILSIATTMTTLFNVLEMFYYFMKFDKTTSEELDVNRDEHQKSVDGYVPIIMSAINYNGLIFFLVANLLTGLVNIVFRTLLLTPFESITILFVYMFIVCGFMSFLYVNKIKLKFW